MNETDEKKEALRAAVDKAIKDYSAHIADERDGSQDAYVTSWAVYAEYTTVELTQTGYAGSVTIIPDDQSFSTTRGCFELGAEGFTRK